MKSIMINHGKIDLIPYVYIEGGEKYLKSFGHVNIPYVHVINSKLINGNFTDFIDIDNYSNSFNVQNSRWWEIASKYFR